MPEKKPRKFLFVLTDGGGTVPPELGVARRLVEQGHGVQVLAEASIATQVRAAGAVMLDRTLFSAAGSQAPGRTDRGAAQPSHTAYRDWEMRSPLALARGMADHMIAGPARSVAQATAAQIREDRPDRVVASFVAFGAMIAAEAAAVDFDVLIPNIYPVPVRGIPPMGMGLRAARTPLGRARDTVLNALATRVLGHYALPLLNAARGEFGLPALRRHWDQVRAARRQLVLSSAAFEFPGEFPPSVRHVGPVLDDPSWADAGQAAGAGEPADGAEAEWTPPPGEGPLVLVSLSSTYQGQRDVVQNVIDALLGLQMRGLVTTGPGLDPQRLRDGGGVQVVRSVPHRQAMQQAALVITHGGHGTVMKALVAGVPMVVLPHGRDQPDNAVRVEARGAGLRLPKDASPQAIAEAVETVLSTPTHRAAAQRLGGLIREEMGNGRLLEELEAEH